MRPVGWFALGYVAGVVSTLVYLFLGAPDGEEDYEGWGGWEHDPSD